MSNLRVLAALLIAILSISISKIVIAQTLDEDSTNSHQIYLPLVTSDGSELELNIDPSEQVYAANKDKTDVWINLGPTTSRADFATGSFAVSPNFASDGTIFVSSNNGVYRTTNAGKSWKLINNGLVWNTDYYPNYDRHNIAISPDYANDHTVFVFSQSYGALYRTLNAGNNWELVYNTPDPSTDEVIILLSPNYATDKTLFVASPQNGGTEDTFAKSTDGGATWQSSSLVTAPNAFTVTDMKFSPNYSQDKTVFGAGVFVSPLPDDQESSVGKLIRSLDSGATWAIIDLPNTVIQGQGPWSIVLSPNFSIDQTIFVGTDATDGAYHLMKSTDGGANWQPASSGIPTTDVQSLTISPDFSNDGVLYAATGGDGVFVSTNRGDSWRVLYNGFDMDGGSFFPIALSPNYRIDHTIFVSPGNQQGSISGVWKYTFSELPTSVIDYFALGDSVASGHGLMDDTKDGQAASGCRLSYRSYPYKVVTLLQTRYLQVNFPKEHFLACSGATTRKFQKQVDKVLKNIQTVPPDHPILVSITIGANDFGWSNINDFLQHLEEDDNIYYAWVDQTATDIKQQLKSDVERLLHSRPTVAIIITEYHNPFNTNSILFDASLFRDRNLRCAFNGCYPRTEYAILQLNGTFIETWMELGQPARLQIATLHGAFQGHESPSTGVSLKTCGGNPPALADTWIQYPTDPESNSYPPLPKEIKKQIGTWSGDCFHPNEAGAQAYATAVNEDARRLAR